MSLAKTIEKLYGRPAEHEAVNYGRVEDTLAGRLGELVILRLSAYRAPTRQQPDRWVSHFYDTTYEAGVLADESLQFDLSNHSCFLKVKDREPGLTLTDLNIPLIHARRDIGNGLSYGFNRELLTNNPEDPRLHVQTELLVGRRDINTYLARPIMGSLPDTHQKVRACLEATGLIDGTAALGLRLS